MSEHISNDGAGNRTVTDDLQEIVGGGSVVAIGGVVDRGFRWMLKWMLAVLLGPAALGVYQMVVMVTSVVGLVAPMGMDNGAMLFMARYRQNGNRGAMRALLTIGVPVTVLSGLLAALCLWFTVDQQWFWPDKVVVLEHIGTVVWVVAFSAPLVFMVGAFRGEKNMLYAAAVQQIALPSSILLISFLLVFVAGFGVEGGIYGYLVGTGVAFLVGITLYWRRFGSIISSSDVPFEWHFGEWLKFSLPQSMSEAAFRLNLYMDILMLGWLSSVYDVGLYTAAVSMSLFSALPLNALWSIFGPIIAEKVAGEELESIDRLLKVVSRWLVLTTLPVFGVLLLLPDFALYVFGEEYIAASTALAILALGQSFNVLAAPAEMVIPMAGRSGLQLFNGVGVLSLNVGLNYVLIPEYGIVGAALATSATLVVGGLVRLAQVYYIWRCTPLSRPLFSLMSVSVLALGSSWWLTVDETAFYQVSMSLVAVAVCLLFGVLGPRLEEEDELFMVGKTKVLKRIKS